MKNKEFRKLLRRNKPNAGFTLFELLVGLVISSVIIGALGFGLITVLNNTQTQTSKTKARSETSRAMEFISEEIKRAKSIESDATNSPGFDADSDNPADGTDDRVVVLALEIPNLTERVIYYLQDKNLNNWNGPQILARWGPPLDEDGNYTGGTWQYEALIDGIKDTDLASSPCKTGETLTPAIEDATEGFYACVSDDDGDGIVEDGLTDTNGDSVVDANDSTDDVDGIGFAAQIFFTGDLKNASNLYDNKYSADTKVSARAKEADVNNQEDRLEDTVGFTSLGATYSCNTSGDWRVRTDFGNDPSDSDNTTKWIHQDDRQPQPLKVNTSNDLVITTSAIAPDGTSNCISLGNEFKSDGVTPTDGTEALSSYDHSVSITIDFDDPATFNGNETDQPDVTGDGYAMVYRKGSEIVAYDGYDPDNDPTNNDDPNSKHQKAIADFLVSKGYAVKDGTTYRLFEGKDDPLLNIYGQPGYDSTKPSSIILADNERIISLELGQFDNGQTQSTNPDAADYNDVTDDSVDQDDYYDTDGDGEMHPGFDGQDNVIILTNDKFDTTTD